MINFLTVTQNAHPIKALTNRSHPTISHKNVFTDGYKPKACIRDFVVYGLFYRKFTKEPFVPCIGTYYTETCVLWYVCYKQIPIESLLRQVPLHHRPSDVRLRGVSVLTLFRGGSEHILFRGELTFELLTFEPMMIQS